MVYDVRCMEISERAPEVLPSDAYDEYDGLVVYPENISPMQLLRLRSMTYVQATLSKASPKAITFQASLVDDEAADLGLRFKASEAILDRFMGKATQSVHVEHKEPRPIIFSPALEKLRKASQEAVDATAKDVLASAPGGDQ
jgi:hypothetical protein